MKTNLRIAITGMFLLGFCCGALAPRAAADDGPNAEAAAQARATAAGDPILSVLLIELERSKAQLKMEGVPAPYYIEYRVHEIEAYNADAAFGAVREERHSRGRVLRAVVRVGDYKQDSYFGQGAGETEYLPLDNDPIALRRQIWLATDEAYKNATEALTQKQAYMKQFAADPAPVDDFARATPVDTVGELAHLRADEPAWKSLLVEATDLYRQYPAVQSLSASLRFMTINEYFVNSEGSVTRGGRASYSLVLNAITQAADGMRLFRNPDWNVARIEEMPARAALLGEIRKALDSLVALREAPIAEEEYRGPVLFSADAANDIFASLIGNNVLGHKPQPGRPNRTTGLFATSFKSRVLPAFLTIVDDPSVKQFQGKSLLGSYDVDSEGVRAQAVVAVDKGTLTSYLVGRQPIRDFPASNGHGRSAPGGFPQPSIGSLFIRTTEPKPAAEMRQQMLGMLREQQKPYGYRVETLGAGNSPRLLYRIYAKDGHEELVRGAVFSELDVRTLRNNLIAAGDDPLVSNRPGGTPTTVVSPSILLDELEIKRADTSKDKLPEYPAPPLAAAGANSKHESK
ncbi:MAG: peptidase U62 [Acidobacteriia bacterium]|nr:peptidase U62 [Terriglobia bacterium]